MGLRITIENESDSSEECSPCAKCGAELEMDDKYCCDCGTKVPIASATPAKARLTAMNKMAPPTADTEAESA